MKVFRKQLLRVMLAAVVLLSMLLSTGCIFTAKKAPDTLQFEKTTTAQAETVVDSVESSQAKNNSSKTDKNDKKDDKKDAEEEPEVEEDGEYTSKEEVAKYIHLYGKLPKNFITKKEAQKLGWDKSKNYVGEVAPGKSIGGDKFGNYEGLLPEKEGRQYYECDINYQGKKRGADRIIYSNDGLVYFTEDHYESFELLYGEE